MAYEGKDQALGAHLSTIAVDNAVDNRGRACESPCYYWAIAIASKSTNPFKCVLDR